MDKEHLEYHEQLALALSGHFADGDIEGLRAIIAASPYAASLGELPDNALHGAAALMGTYPQETRKLRGAMDLERQQGRELSILNAERIRQLGRYGFRLVYVGTETAEIALKRYQDENPDNLSALELHKLQMALNTARCTALGELS